MQSPKFAKKASHFRRVVSASRLVRLWKEGVRDRLRKQIVPDAVEFLDFHLQLRQRCNEIEALICAGAYVTKPILRLRSEKSKGLCRQLSLPSPEDALVLQALSDSLWRDISPKAPSKTAFYAPQDQPFAKQNPLGEDDEWGYGPLEAWLDFQREILKFSTTRKFVVVTDIANYYDFIVHSYLRSILADLGLEREYALDLLLYILDAMLWRPDYMPNYGIGVPQMDFDAPRLLAHTHLFEVDELFSNDPNVDFARYMDDMDFGVDTEAKAKEVLRDLDLALQTRNIRVNSGKTKILTADEAREHFRVKDNAAVDVLLQRVQKLFFLEYWFDLYARLAGRWINNGVAIGYFDSGNGDKILKRLLGLSARLGGSISDAAFRRILYTKAGLRQNLLQHWCRSPLFVDQLKIIIGFLSSGEAIDDLSKVLVGTSITAAPMQKRFKYSQIWGLLFGLDRTSPFDLYARLWILSKVETPSRLWHEIQQTVDVWSRYRFLSRLVAGFYGLLIGSKGHRTFVAVVRRWGGPDAISVLEFHENVHTTAQGWRSVKPFLEAPNTSLPLGISHPKALILASALWNKQIPKVQRAKLLGIHAAAMADTYYQTIFSRIISRAR
jgi:hypothetical protein